jgi:hypothetical protein
MSHVGFMGQAPHYLQNAEIPAAIEALLSYVARLLHLNPDMSHFDKAIMDFRAQCDRAVARNRATREHVQQPRSSTTRRPARRARRCPAASSTRMRELQDFLRGQPREGGEENPASGR